MKPRALGTFSLGVYPRRAMSTFVDLLGSTRSSTEPGGQSSRMGGVQDLEVISPRRVSAKFIAVAPTPTYPRTEVLSISES